jgi:dephospho-CoA kinase
MSQRWPHRFIVGLTGNIATGKSAVMRMAAERGALSLDADDIVHDILDTDRSVQAAIAVAFGDHLRRQDGSIDRVALGAIVFEDEGALRDLELLVHPAVRREVSRRIDDSAARVVVVEAIKLLEGELAELCDQIWVTRCPRTLQEKRLIICRGMDAEAAATRIDAQNPQEAKVARADVVIDTDGTMAQTQAQFERAWMRLQKALPDSRRAEPEPEPSAAPTAPQKRGAPDAASIDRPGNVLVRRARPSDIPTILLLMKRVSGGRVKLSRADLLKSFSERSYLIGQIGMDVVCVLGWNTDSTTAACLDQVYANPAEALAIVGPAMMQEIERSARELICEVVLVFLSEEAPAEFRELLRTAGYEQMAPDQMHRAWRQTIKERRPQGSVIMAKVMRDVRVA